MQWFKSAMMVSTAVFVAAMASNGCSGGTKGGPDGGDGGVIPMDGGKDVAQQGDGGGGQCPSSDPACEVCDVSSYSPTAQGKPIGPKSGACTSAEITAFVNACLGTSASQTACNSWQQSEAGDGGTANCLNCIFTQDTAASWGVLHCSSTGCGLNIPGCVDLALGQASQENTTSNGSCGDYLNASYGCQDAACSSCTGTDFDTCANDAVSGECKSYADAFQNASQCAAFNSDNPPAALNNCFPASQSGFTDAELNTLTNFFCGQ